MAINDNWANRPIHMTCNTCVFFVPKRQTPITGTNKEGEQIIITHSTNAVGRCRRHAPSLAGFPVVLPDDWCGDHKIDENKV